MPAVTPIDYESSIDHQDVGALEHPRRYVGLPTMTVLASVSRIRLVIPNQDRISAADPDRVDESEEHELLGAPSRSDPFPRGKGLAGAGHRTSTPRKLPTACHLEASWAVPVSAAAKRAAGASTSRRGDDGLARSRPVGPGHELIWAIPHPRSSRPCRREGTPRR